MKKVEYVLWGLAKDETEQWKEQILLSKCNDMNKIEIVKRMASKDGFHSFRVAKLDMNIKPNFGDTIN